MPNHANTDNESPPLDAEAWDIVFQAYAEYPILAFILAQHLEGVKSLFFRGPKHEAIAALDRAIDSLMPHTNFRDAGRYVYLLAVTGTLLPEHEDMLRKIRELM
jgi:hypothetical protein